jgi:hypothetical protein
VLGLFCCLRRWFLSLAVCVGGPLRSKREVFQKLVDVAPNDGNPAGPGAIGTRGIRNAELDTRALFNQNSAVDAGVMLSPDEQPMPAFHALAILPAVPQKRNGRFFPVLAGGNA